MDPDDPRHGTRRGYVVGCRDDCCREAANAYNRARYAAQVGGTVRPRQLEQHGTRARYRKGCRDECCRAAERAYRARYRAARR